MTPTEAYIALNMLRGIGSIRLRRLLEVFKSPERILLARASELREVQGIGREVAETIVGWEKHVDLAAELQRIADFGAKIVAHDSPEYPALLSQIDSPPIVLYVWGELQERDRHALGVVGSRKASHYGLECAKKLSYQLAYAGLTVVSGLARGIDTAAHQGALAAHGRTIAVLGSGFLKLYPAGNDEQARLSFNAALQDNMRVSTYLWAMNRAQTAKTNVFVYMWDHTLPGPDAETYGVFHTSEVPYVMNALDRCVDRKITDTDYKIADTLSSYWANFIKTGNPNGQGLPRWPTEKEKPATSFEIGDRYQSIPVAGDAAKQAFLEKALKKPPSVGPGA